jgi:hypothetical protein
MRQPCPADTWLRAQLAPSRRSGSAHRGGDVRDLKRRFPVGLSADAGRARASGCIGSRPSATGRPRSAGRGCLRTDTLSDISEKSGSSPARILRRDGSAETSASAGACRSFRNHPGCFQQSGNQPA